MAPSILHLNFLKNHLNWLSIDPPTAFLPAMKISQIIFALAVLDRAEDDLGNFLLIKIKIENTTIIIGSIYGPNINDNSIIYDELDIELNRLNIEKTIFGGSGTVLWIAETLI